MRGLRPRVHLIACLTVALQLAAPLCASAALCCKDPAALAGNTAEVMECCKKGGAHICPMKKPPRPARTTEHTMTSCRRPEAKIFVALLGPMGVLAASPSLLPPAAAPHDDTLSPAAPLWVAVASSRHPEPDSLIAAVVARPRPTCLPPMPRHEDVRRGVRLSKELQHVRIRFGAARVLPVS